MSEGTDLRQRVRVEDSKEPGGAEDEKFVPWIQRRKKKPPTPSQIGCKVFYWFFIFIIMCFAGITIYLYNMESKIEPHGFRLPPVRPLEGPLAPNSVLQKAKKLLVGKIKGPESLAICNGKIFTGTSDGKIVRLESDTEFTVVAKFGKEPCGNLEDEDTCGRPLGMKASGHGTLYVMDAYLGLFEVDCETGKFNLLVSSSRTYDAKPIGLGNDVQELPNGDIFITDSDFKWKRREFGYIMAESAPNGRLLWYNPVNKLSNIALNKFHSINGIQLSHDKQFLLICESTRFRVLKYHLQGDQAGSYEIFIDSLPGIPDNISPSQGGGYWVGLGLPGLRWHYGIHDFLAAHPFIRDQLFKLVPVEYLISLKPKYGMIVELSEEGEIINSLHDPSGMVTSSVSEVLDTGDALYLGSFFAPYLLKLDYNSKTAKKWNQS